MNILSSSWLVLYDLILLVVIVILSTDASFLSPAAYLRRGRTTVVRTEPPLLVLGAKKMRKKTTMMTNNNEVKKQKLNGNRKIIRGFGGRNNNITISLDQLVTVVDYVTSKTEGSDISTIYTNLLTWIQSNPYSYMSPKFILRPSSLGGGYGGFTNTFIAKDEIIMRIPRDKCCITPNDALNDKRCGVYFRRIREQQLPSYGMILICGYMTLEYLIASQQKQMGLHVQIDNSSSRMPYLTTLPWTQDGMFAQDHVLFWSDEEVHTLLSGSRAYDDALLIRKTVDDAIELLKDFILPIVRRHGSDANVELLLNESFKRTVKGAFVIALSRSFAEEVDDDNPIDDGTTPIVEIENVLLPVIDMLQHSNIPNTILEPYDDCVILRAQRDIEGGEELFHQYRKEDENVIPPHKFFTRYGFIPGVTEPIKDLLISKSRLFFDS